MPNQRPVGAHHTGNPTDNCIQWQSGICYRPVGKLKTEIPDNCSAVLTSGRNSTVEVADGQEIPHLARLRRRYSSLGFSIFPFSSHVLTIVRL
jgi:hypothetical protein